MCLLHKNICDRLAYNIISKRLTTAENDAKVVESILKEKYGFNTNLLLNATREEIVMALNGYRKKLKEHDNLLIYYAGHGEYVKKTDKAYWLPVDASIDDNTNWIIADTVTANIKLIPSKHILIVADSCYSGAFSGTKRAGTNLASKRYLRKMLEKASRTLMSSGANEPVSDIGGGKHSVFAEAFINGLQEMEQDVFTAEALYDEYIKVQVGGNVLQTPQYSPIRGSGHSAGDFVFMKIQKRKTNNQFK